MGVFLLKARATRVLRLADNLIIIGIPIAFLIIDGFGSWMMRGEGCHLEDWCKGFDAVLAASTGAAAMVYQRTSTAVSPASLSLPYLFLLCCVVFLFGLAVMHHEVTRRYRAKEISNLVRMSWLLVVGNVFGVAMLAAFLLLIR